MKEAILALGALLLCTVASCVVPNTRETTLFTPAQMAWPDVEVDYLRGVDDGVSEGDLVMPAADRLRTEATRMRSALKDKNINALRMVPWPTMAPWAQRGIDDALADGELGPTVAESARLHLENFNSVIARLRSTGP